MRGLRTRHLERTLSGPVYGHYDVSPDGRQFVLVRPFDLSRGREVVVALDWLAQPGRAPDA